MTATEIDRNAALIVVDLQEGLRGAPFAPNPLAEMTAKSAALANTFRNAKLPVVLVTVSGVAPGRTELSRGQPPRQYPANFAELLPELGPQAGDILITKSTWGAFTNTSLAQQLKERGVTQVVITGCATSVGVETTAREAYGLGFNVTVVDDAVSDIAADAHTFSLTRICPRLGEVGTTAEILTLLKRLHA
jgi:nicotinamidase-related amidase